MSDSYYDSYYAPESYTPDISSYASGYDFGPSYSPEAGGTYQPMPGSDTASVEQDSLNPWIGAGLGALGPLAGLLGGLASGGRGTAQTAQMPFQGRVAGSQMGGALDQLGQFGMGQMPLQQMQMSLLRALQSGQGLPQGYQQLIEQAYQPQMGDIASQAIMSARNRGFAGGAELLNSGPGGAIAGPALSNLQGQMAQSKLGLMQSLPGLFNQPMQMQGQALQGRAQGYGNMMGQYAPYATQQPQQPMGQLFGQGIGNIFAGAAAGGAQATQANQQQAFQNSLLKAIQGMSGRPEPGY